MSYSLSYQRQTVEHIAALYDKGDLQQRDRAVSLRQTAVVLAWLERRQELMRAIDRLERERPDLVDLFREFPGAQIADVRPMFPSFNNGSGADD